MWQTNYDLVDYINVLREGILEAYTSIVSGFKTGGKADVLLPYIGGVFGFLHLALTDQDRTEGILRSAIGVIGDLAEAFPNGQLKEPLSSPWVADILKAGRTKLGGSETKKVTKWAREVSVAFDHPDRYRRTELTIHRAMTDGSTGDAVISSRRPWFHLFALSFCAPACTYSNTRNTSSHAVRFTMICRICTMSARAIYHLCALRKRSRGARLERGQAFFKNSCYGAEKTSVRC